MGQEQSYAHASVAHVRRYQDKYEEPVTYRSCPERSSDYDDHYKRHKARRSAESFKSDHSTDSSGYRSASSAYECRSDRSSKSGYYCTSLYKNDHYKDVNKELYKPVKIPKEKRYKVQLFDNERDELKSARLRSYLNDTDKAATITSQTPKKAGIRNYTPKIITEEEQRKTIESWI